MSHVVAGPLAGCASGLSCLVRDCTCTCHVCICVYMCMCVSEITVQSARAAARRQTRVGLGGDECARYPRIC